MDVDVQAIERDLERLENDASLTQEERIEELSRLRARAEKAVTLDDDQKPGSGDEQDERKKRLKKVRSALRKRRSAPKA